MSPIVGSLAGLSARSLGWGLSAPAATFELIQTQVLASSAASVTFNLSAGQQATYKHLQLRITAKGNTTTNANVHLQFNSDTGANYSYHELYGTGSAAGSANALSQTKVIQVAYLPPTGSQFSASIIDVLDAFSTAKNKTVRTLKGEADVSGGFLGVSLISGAWYNTAAISSITVLGDFAMAVGSRFSLYGVR